MRPTPRSLFGLVLAAGLVSGCNNGPPGGGLTNGSAPDLSADKAGSRTDMPERNRTEQGEMKGAGGTDGTVRDMENVTGSTTTGGRTSAGTGGYNRSGAAPAKDPEPRGGADRKDTVQAVGSAGAQPPTSKDAGSAAGATKAPGNIKVGTPTGPQ